MELGVKFKGEYIPEYMPEYAIEGDAGFDLRADVKEIKIIKPGKIVVIPTGLSFEIPAGYEMQIRSRSGLAAKNGVIVLNAPGTIDPNYTGIVGAILINLGDNDFNVTPGMKICQAVISKFEKVDFVLKDVLHTTNRNESGFGSTGI